MHYFIISVSINKIGVHNVNMISCLNKKIYIILSQTGALTSKVLKLFTKDNYNHVSIALSPTLKEMYSFGRKYAYFPFIGGFVEEGKDIGTFQRFANTEVMVLELSVTIEEYNAVKYFIQYFIAHKKNFRYSYLGVFLALFNKQQKSTKKFYCSQFVKLCLTLFNIDNSKDLPNVVKPIDFLKLKSKKVIYSGLLRNYK